MTPEEFLREFGALAETRTGLADLRNLVRELAASGRLLSSSVHRQRQACLAEIVASMQNGLSKRSGTTGEPTAVLRLADIKKGRISANNLRTIRLTSQEQEKYKVDVGDVLVIRVNGSADLVGTFVPCEGGRYAYSDHLIRLQLDPAVIDYRYLCVAASTATARGHIYTKTVTTAGQKTVNQGGLGSLPLLIPPLPEQKRIVEKVDQLMALCDELEAAQKKRRATSFLANKAALSALTSATGTKPVKEAWKRVQDNFEVLYDAPETVQDLRQVLLELALSGRLSQRNAETVSAGDLVRSFGHTPLQSDSPSGWAHVTLEMIADQRLGKMLDAAKNRGQLRPYLRNLNVQWFRFEISDVLQMRITDEEAEEFLVRPGDLLVCEGGEPGRCAIWREERPIYYQKALHRVRPRHGVSATFLAYRLRLDTWARRLDELFTGATIKHLTGRSLRQYAFPLPPTGEQERIVAKVDQLMALCDELDTLLQRSRIDGEALMKAVVEHLVAAPQAPSEPMAMVG